LLLAATGAQVLETLLEQFLELCTGAALEQHVPVATRSLGLDGLGLDGLALRVEQHALLAGLRRLPRRRHLGVVSEHDVEGRTVGSAIHGLLTRGELNALLALQALSAEPHSAQTAVRHGASLWVRFIQSYKPRGCAKAFNDS